MSSEQEKKEVKKVQVLLQKLQITECSSVNALDASKKECLVTELREVVLDMSGQARELRDARQS